MVFDKTGYLTRVLCPLHSSYNKTKRDKGEKLTIVPFLLAYLDSNQDRQNQNLLYYHYTIGQSLPVSYRLRAAKIYTRTLQTKFHSCLCQRAFSR